MTPTNEPIATYQCPDCRRAQLFDRPGADPITGTAPSEWACTVCGAALIVDPLLGEASPRADVIRVA